MVTVNLALYVGYTPHPQQGNTAKWKQNKLSFLGKKVSVLSPRPHRTIFILKWV